MFSDKGFYYYRHPAMKSFHFVPFTFSVLHVVYKKESVESLVYRIEALVSLCANKQYPTPSVYIDRYITKHGDECLYCLSSAL